jgi:hypothetical protein
VYRLSPAERDKRERLQKALSNSKATSKSKALNYLKCIVSLPWREIREREVNQKPTKITLPHLIPISHPFQMHRLSPADRDKREVTESLFKLQSHKQIESSKLPQMYRLSPVERDKRER